ncbi:DUF6470 family protein [Cytobacillus sp.]|uniref:DUF6470 family protein n=1 Tax=Cytobacillus sp. TaxID=2675269 RepID=UPI003517F99B
MNMPYLQTHITSAQLGINYSRPDMKMKQPQADLQIKQPAADLEISYEPSSLSIDQSEALADVDRKGPLRRTKEWVEQARQVLAEGVAKRARQGDQMMEIEHGGGAIARISRENSNPPMKEIGFGFLPKTPFRVKLDYDPGKVDIEFTPNKPVIDSKANKPIIEHENWKAEIYIKQKDSIDFELKNFKIDQYV